jgi:prephenate dehydratase
MGSGGPSPRIAYQGEAGAFSERAARKLAPHAALVPCHYFPELFAALRSGYADMALVPIENTLAGAVTDSYDLLLQDSDLYIQREAILQIHHQLIGLPGATLEQIRVVQSHPVALAQCRKFVGAHPGVQVRNTHDTAGSVRVMMEAGDPSVASIASANAAEVYGGEILARDIEDDVNNLTRFWLLSRVPNGDGERCSLITELNGLSQLSTVLRGFEEKGMSLTSIVPRPIPGRPWGYRCVMDFQVSNGNHTDPGSYSRWLGRYHSVILE